MKKTVLFCIFCIVSFGSATLISCSREEEKPLGVVINGITWATCNVDAPGTFAAKPEDAGMFYQWNRKKGWPVTGDITGWDASDASGGSWEAANDPSPAGWRVPTADELASLLDEEKVTIVQTTRNDVSGMKFTDKSTGNTIFLPAAGYRWQSEGELGGGGNYWSGAAYSSYDGWSLFFNISDPGYGYSFCRLSCGFSVRSVRAE